MPLKKYFLVFFLSTILLLLVSPPQAHTSGIAEKSCPLCFTTFSTLMDLSGTTFGQRLDFKPTGPITVPWSLAVCPKCHFVLFKSSEDSYTQQEIRDLTQYVQSSTYRKVPENAPSYYRLALILTFLQKSPETLSRIYLEASWQVEDNESLCSQYLQKSINYSKLVFESPSLAPAEKTILNFLLGELYRRTKQFSLAESQFKSLQKQVDPKAKMLPDLIRYELELIQKKDSQPHDIPSTKNKD